MKDKAVRATKVSVKSSKHSECLRGYLLRALDVEVYWVGVLWDSVPLHPSIGVPVHPKWQQFLIWFILGKMGSPGFPFTPIVCKVVTYVIIIFIPQNS